MLRVKSTELSASWHWYAVDVEVVYEGQCVEASVTLLDRWESNSDSHVWEIEEVNPPELAGVIEGDMTKILVGME